MTPTRALVTWRGWMQTLEAEQADQLRRVQDERTTLRDTVARMQVGCPRRLSF